MKHLKVGDRVRFTFNHEVFKDYIGRVGTIISYNTHGWSDESKHTIVVEWDDFETPMVGDVALVDKE